MANDMNPELQALRDENQRLRELCRTHEIDRDTKEYYEQLLTEIGRAIGCGHIDDQLPSCVGDIARQREDAIRGIRYWSYCTRQGMIRECPEKREELAEWLQSVGVEP